MKNVTIKAPVAIALQAAPDEFRGDPNDVEKRVLRARYERELPADFWELDHVCPLCHRTLDAYTFAAHAPGCIKEKAPRGKLYVPGVDLKE